MLAEKDKFILFYGDFTILFYLFAKPPIIMSEIFEEKIRYFICFFKADSFDILII